MSMIKRKIAKQLKKVKFLVLLGAILSGCSLETEYEKVKRKELASGKEVKELFLGLEFGMSRQQFFDICWEWNKQGVLTEGAHEFRVLYQPELGSGSKLNMFFYPKFEEETIYYMPVEFKYQNWFPTNPNTSSDKLVDDVVNLLESWYGKGFFRVEDKDGAFAMVKIDGNRLIRVYIKSISEVRVDMLDLRVKDIKQIYS